MVWQTFIAFSTTPLGSKKFKKYNHLSILYVHFNAFDWTQLH